MKWLGVGAARAKCNHIKILLKNMRRSRQVIGDTGYGQIMIDLRAARQDVSIFFMGLFPSIWLAFFFSGN